MSCMCLWRLDEILAWLKPICKHIPSNSMEISFGYGLEKEDNNVRTRTVESEYTMDNR